MPKERFWTDERQLQVLASITAQPVLPTHFGMIDSRNPPAYLMDAAAAAGDGATAAGVDFQLRQEPGLKEALLGGRHALLRKMIEKSESCSAQVSNAVPSLDSRDELLLGLLRLFGANGVLKPNPFRSQLLRALSLSPSSQPVPSVPAAISAQQQSVVVPSSHSQQFRTISALRLALKVQQASRARSEREVRDLKRQLTMQRNQSESVSVTVQHAQKAAAVLGRCDLNMLLSAIGCGRSSEVFTCKRRRDLARYV